MNTSKLESRRCDDLLILLVVGLDIPFYRQENIRSNFVQIVAHQ